MDPLTGLCQEFLYDSSRGGLELHRRHDQDIGTTLALLDDSCCASRLSYDDMVVTIVVVQAPEFHHWFAEDVSATDASCVHECFATGIEPQRLLVDQGL